MDVAQDLVVSTVLEGAAQSTSIFQILKSDCPVPRKPKVEEHEVLGNYRGSGTTEVERERIFNRSEIMEFENEILREEFLRTPDDPTYADRGATELICSVGLSIHLT